VTKAVFRKISFPRPKSHKGQNGIVLVVAGSSQYHGSLVFSAVTASRIADLVFVCTSKENFSVVKKYSPAFIVRSFSEAKKLAKKADSILLGPGIPETKAMKNLVSAIVSENKGKGIVLDATALRLIPAKRLHTSCVVTPHSNEFKALFKMTALRESVYSAAKKFGCIVCLKGQTDFISDGKTLFYNSTGNAGMTKGGTGDVLAGLIAGFASQSPLLESALAAFYLNGFAADMLKKQNSTMFNAVDLMESLPNVLKTLAKH